MLMRKLGRTGMKVAALCLGGNTFGWTTDQKASEAVLDAYLEAGGNFIDTADVYSRWAPGNKGGESETALGIWMAARKNRQAVIMATKACGPMGSGPNDGGLSRLHIMQAVEASLTRLKTDYQALIRVDLDGTEAAEGDQWDLGQRIREVEQALDGTIWLLTDEGQVLRLIAP